MNDYVPSVTLPEDFSEISNDTKEVHQKQKFKMENITIIRPPLLKAFYWKSLDIDGLNEKLLSEENHIEHNLMLPISQLNSKPLKIVFWLRSLCQQTIHLQLKRVKNCPCVQMETRVGFNQFRYLYHCPHRRLINISQEIYNVKPDELVAMSMVAYFYIFGEYVLSYELSVSDSRVIILNFHANITIIDPVKSILNTDLIPANIKEHRRFSQAIWIRNITMQNLHFICLSRERGFRLINPNMDVPRQSIWPLIVEYRPCDFENNVELVIYFGEAIQSSCSAGVRYKIPLKCKGYLEEKFEKNDVPLLDYECADFLYVIYPNKLMVESDLDEERTFLVAVHNYDQKCMLFQWQTYIINDYFRITFEPTAFTLKSHHSKLCVVHVVVFKKPLYFKFIPIVLEVHRILDKSTQIARELLTEVESIDDPKWLEDSYVEHVLLHMDLKVNFPKEHKVIVNPLLKPKSLTIFEKLFWEYLSKSNYMRKTNKVPRNLTYEQVLRKETNTKDEENTINIDKIGALNILSFITAEACRDLSKNYRFLPIDIMDHL